MNVKVLVRPSIPYSISLEGTSEGKVEYFNGISSWNFAYGDTGVLQLNKKNPNRKDPKEDPEEILVAWIKDWIWIKVDE